MTFAGWLTIALFAIILTALAFPLGSYMANVYTGERVFLTPIFGGPERLLYRILRVDPDARSGLEVIREEPDHLLARRLAVPVLRSCARRTPSSCRTRSTRSASLGSVECDVQHRLVVHDEHQLAVLQRRDDDELPQPDDRADGSELAVGRRGHRRGGRAVRGIIGRSGKSLGNFWQDLVRTILYVLAPLSVIARDRARLPGRDRRTSPTT